MMEYQREHSRKEKKIQDKRERENVRMLSNTIHGLQRLLLSRTVSALKLIQYRQ
jgi:hypothetical protein